MTDSSPDKALYTRKRARRSLMDTIGFRIVSQGFTVLGYIVVVRALSEHDFGVYSLLYAFIPVVSTIASLGLEQTLRRFQPEYLRGGDFSSAAWLVRWIASARFATNVAVIAVTLLAWNTIAPLFHLTPYRFEFMLFGSLLLLYFQSRVMQLSLASYMQHRHSVGALAVLNGAKLACYALLMTQGLLSLRNVIVADIVASVVQYAYLVVMHRRCSRMPAGGGEVRAKRERRRLLRYALYNNFNDAGALILTSRSDNFFIAAMANPAAVGAYSFYTRLNEMVSNLLPTRIFENVLQPLFFSTPRREAGQRVPRYFTLLSNMNLLLQLPILAYAIVYHREIVQVLFAGKFLDSSLLLPVVVGFGTLSGVIATPVTMVAQYEERVAIILWSKIFAIYNVLAILVLVPVLGLQGAAIATGTAQLFKNLFVWWHVRDMARWGNFRAVLGCALLIWGAVVLACSLLRAHLPMIPPLGHLAIGAAVCAIGGLLYARSPAIAGTDRELLASVLHGREGGMLRLAGLIPRGVGAGRG